MYTTFSIVNKRKNGLFKSIIITFFPVLGIILVLVLFHSFGQKHSKEQNSQVHSTLELGTNLVNVASELNYVPIRDALLLNDNRTKRRLLIHCLKENAVPDPIILQMALENEDSETSHYAATAIMEMKRKLQNSIQIFSARMHRHPDDMSITFEYADTINDFLQSGFLDEKTKQKYQGIYSALLEKILDDEKRTNQHFIDKINLELEQKNYQKAKLYSNRFKEEYPLDEMAYLLAMKLQFSLNNQTELKKVLKELKERPIYLSEFGLSIVRYWT
ncbi:hypothetical protein [Ornithinibacillus salinisoli]